MDPISVRREKLIVVPVDVLWQIVEGASTLPSWLPLCERCEVVTGEGFGRRQRMYARWGRKSVEIDQEIVEYIPNSRLSWTHTDERIDGRPAPKISTAVRLTIELHAAGAGTRVVLSSRNVPAGLVGALVLRFVAVPRIQRAFDRALENLSGCGT